MVLDLDYSTKVADTEIYGLNQYLNVSKDIDIDVSRPTSYIDYELQPEAREWGIKSIYVFIKKLTVSIAWEVSTEDLSDEEKESLIKAGGIEFRNTIEGTIEIDTTDNKWDITTEVEFEKDGALSISEVYIELSDKTITVS